MSGYVYQFGNTTLPGAAGEWGLSVPAVRQVQKTLGGLYDPNGTDVARLDHPYPIRVMALAYESTRPLMGASLDDYRSFVGKRNRLWLKPFDTTQVDRWCWARCDSIQETNSVYNRITQPVELVFSALSPWYGHAYGGAWDLDAGYLFDSGLYFDGTNDYPFDASEDIVLTNAGNRTCTNVGITFYADQSTIATITVTIANKAQWTYTGEVSEPSNDPLIIDCGSKTVLLAGAAAYANFALTASHASPYWLPLAPGNTTVNVAATGSLSGCTVQFTYSDCWV